MNLNNIKQYCFIYLFVVMICISSITSFSLWMDEAIRIRKASLSIECGFWEHQWDLMQVGLNYLLAIWGKAFGKTEIAYRCINIPFLVIATTYMVHILRSYKLSPYWVLLMCCHPIIIYYMNDAGPYIMLLACSCGLYYHCFFSKHIDTISNSIIILIFLFVGFCIHFIFAFAVVLYICSLISRLSTDKLQNIIRKEILLWIIFTPVFLYIAHMYLQHMMHGEDRGWSKPGLFNFGVMLYSFSGFTGLGLPRNDMRAGNYHLITPAMITGVCLLTSSLLYIFSTHYKKVIIILKQKTVISAFALMTLFYIASASRNFQFWERHMIFIFPAFLLILIQLFNKAWNIRPLILNRGVILIIIALTLISSFRLRFIYSYQKDDHKGAQEYVESLGYINSSVPIYAQGTEPFLYRYYCCTDYYNDFPPLPRNIIWIDTATSKEIIKSICETSKNNHIICLILSEKSKSAKLLFNQAESIFREKGFTINKIANFNTYKVLILETSPSTTDKNI